MFSCNDSSKKEKEVENTSPPKIEKTPEEDLGKFGFKNNTQPKKNPVVSSNQLSIVIVPDDNAVEGFMYRFEKINNSWVRQGHIYQINIGKNGLAWGNGELENHVKRGFNKQEGDGKAPAGIFSFGSAFGYAKKEEASFIKMPYIQSTQTLFCVDDSQSEYYNQVVNNEDVNEDWKSAEDMLRKDDLYKWGIFVNHNTPAVSEGGSCIFIHIWRGKGKGTAGCTATTEKNILELLRWLDPKKDPKMILITKKEYPTFQKWFSLPELE